MRPRKKSSLKAIAQKRIKHLFEQAQQTSKQVLANRYVFLARKLAMKARYRLSSAQKHQFCSSCYTFLRPPTNCRIRLRKGTLIYWCLSCKRYTKFAYK